MSCWAGNNQEGSIESINAEDLQNIFQVFQTQFDKKNQITQTEINKSAVLGLLKIYEEEVKVLTERTVVIHAEVLPRNVAYMSPDLSDLKQIKEKLEEWKEVGAVDLILDLRFNQQRLSTEQALSVVSLFTEQEMSGLIQYEGLDQFVNETESTDVWQGNLVLLIDSETGAMEELITKLLLEIKENTLSVGEKTQGKIALYDSIDLSNGSVLKYKKGKIVSVESEEDLYRQRLIPDFKIVLNQKMKAEICSKIKKEGLANWILQTEQKRFNEEDLVLGYNRKVNLNGKNQVITKNYELVIRGAYELLLALQNTDKEAK